MKTWHDFHPTGRKHCSRCKRWRHVRDFCVREWVDIERTVPRRFQSHCEFCSSARLRARRGNRPLNWYPCGKPGTKHYEKSRSRYRRKLRELKRRPPELDPVKVYAYLSRFEHTELDYSPNGSRADYLRLNGMPMSEVDMRSLRDLRNGKPVSYGLVDQMATHHELPMWEIEEVAALPRPSCVL